MIEKFTEWLSRLPPFGGFLRKLTVDENQAQISYKKHRLYILLTKIWAMSTLLLLIVCNFKNVIPSFSKGRIIFDNQSLNLMLILALVIIIAISLWEFLHSRYSPIEKWKLEKLLRGFTEESDLLRHHDNSFNQTKSVKWIYSATDGLITIKLMAGGHVNSEMEKDIARRLHGYFVKETKVSWVLEDRRIKDGLLAMVFSHEKDESLIIDDLSKLEKSNELNIQLTKRLSWTTRQPMGLIVGPTGSGKTSLLKALIISFLASNHKNKIFTIDGKGAFLSVAMGRIGKVATDGQSALELTTELCQIMQQRYEEMNADVDSEKDSTHAESFKQGSILLIADELLALVVEMQASDKMVKPAERIYPQFNSNLMSLIVKGRQASILVTVSGQMMPASILPTEARDSLGLRIALGRMSQQQAQEIFGVGLKYLPRTDTSNYGGLIWLDGLDWELPKSFLSPYYDDNKLPFKATLSKLAEAQGGGLPQA
ncbi:MULTISPECIES: FtsK/SpoIIIE domain-containing protein [Enterococcus]|uniref:FtsK/SpoIIIE domain-containing protein n=1 Tax=Enterococcus TaxID=1350 RepID=UPI0029549EEB|nr:MULTISPECIES: FtsK/SpoIIIE domain-containing protein [Enterococcus]MDV7717408.1 FtsK/SpoIIIE domain-containing protein [Enterococcus faecium]MDV7740645.1 FtsK/SpoIIIE domain-containing protein [Enterococcus gallinarum]